MDRLKLILKIQEVMFPILGDKSTIVDEVLSFLVDIYISYNAMNSTLILSQCKFLVPLPGFKIQFNHYREFHTAVVQNIFPKFICHINFIESEINNDDAILLGNVLRENNSLQSLNLYHNTIGDEGVIGIFEGLKKK